MSCVKKFDNLTPDETTLLHYKDANSQKTKIGGCCSICIWILFVLYAMYQYQFYIVDKNYTYFNQYQEPFEYFKDKETKEVFTVGQEKLPRFFFTFEEGIKTTDTAPITWDKSMIDISIGIATVNITSKGKVRTETYMPLEQIVECKAEFFNFSKEAKHFYEYYSREYSPIYCIDYNQIDDSHPKLYGASMQAFAYRNYSETVFTVSRCSDASASSGSQGSCSDDAQIEAWLENKIIKWYSINYGYEQQYWDEPVQFQDVFRQEFQLDTTKLAQIFNRYKRNIVQTFDNWYNLNMRTIEFFSLHEEAEHRFKYPKSINQTKILEIITQFSGEQEVYYRQSPRIGILLGVIGGIYSIIQTNILIIIGGWLTFNTYFSIFRGHPDLADISEDEHGAEDEHWDLNCWEQFQLYLATGVLACIFKKWVSEKVLDHADKFVMGKTIVKTEFDLDYLISICKNADEKLTPKDQETMLRKKSNLQHELEHMDVELESVGQDHGDKYGVNKPLKS